MRRALLSAALALLGGCGDRLVDGQYKGQATLQIHAVMSASVGQPFEPAGGAVWLGYSTFIKATPSNETLVLPVANLEFPPEFVCDVLGPPGTSGRYAWANRTIAAFIRIARLIVIDDTDQNGKFKVDVDGAVQAPDRLLATSAETLLLFVDLLPVDPRALDGDFLDNWEDAVLGYNLVALDPGAAPPGLTGHIVRSDSQVFFGLPPSPGGP